MIDAQQIEPNMPVLCSKDGQFAIVDHVEGKNSNCISIENVKLVTDKNAVKLADDIPADAVKIK